MESEESESKTVEKNAEWEVKGKFKIICKYGFPLIASFLAIICGSVQLASGNNEEWRQYLKLNDSISAILLIVTGCIILASFLLQLAIKYFPENYIQWLRKRKKLANKIVIGLIICCALLLFVAIVLSFSDIKSVNDTDETAMVQVLDNNYVQNSTANTSTTTTIPQYFTTRLTTTSSTYSTTGLTTTTSTYFTTRLTTTVYNNSYSNEKNYKLPFFNIRDSSETDDADFSFIVDMLQQMLKCCGVESYTDWSLTDWGRSNPTSVPDSCCIHKSPDCGMNYESTSVIFTQGCFVVIARKIIKKAVTTVVISIIVMLLDVISAKYKSIFKILPGCLKRKVMARREADSNNNNNNNNDERDGPSGSSREAKIGNPKDNRKEDAVIEQLTIHVYTKPVISNGGKFEEIGGFPPMTFTFPQVSTKGSLRVFTNPEVLDISSVNGKMSHSTTHISKLQASASHLNITSRENESGLRAANTFPMISELSVPAMTDINSAGNELQSLASSSSSHTVMKSSKQTLTSSYTAVAASSMHSEKVSLEKKNDQFSEHEC